MLAVILGHAEIAMERLDPDDKLIEDVEEIQKAAKRASDLTRQLLAFARKQTIAPRILDLNAVIGDMLKMLRRLIGENIDLHWKSGEGLWQVKMDPAQIDQILANLVVNARDAIDGVGHVSIQTDNVTFSGEDCAEHAGVLPGQYVMLAVSDDGCGMDAETRAKAFEPFFTTKPQGHGTGLGLATVYGIVKQNDGFINVYSEPGRGTTFRIYLASHAAEARAVESANSAEKAKGGTETILLVEDEESLLLLCLRLLEQLGYRVLATGMPGEAIELARANPGAIDLLMTDVVMPGMSGRDLQRRIDEIQPGVKCLFMSGYTSDVIAHRGVLDEGVRFVQKPFSIQVLAAKLREALAD
jgi:two-component system, cell cycle sensor histidine kinase and response regulator CckA